MFGEMKALIDGQIPHKNTTWMTALGKTFSDVRTKPMERYLRNTRLHELSGRTITWPRNREERRMSPPTLGFHIGAGDRSLL